MPVLSATNLTHQFGEDIILDGVSVSIEKNERIGIVGRNGTGKSTLLKFLAGINTPDSGSVSTAKGESVGYLAQHHDLDESKTLRGAVAGAFSRIHELAIELEHVFESMSDADQTKLESLLKKQQRIEHEIDTLGGIAVDHKIDAIIQGLGFTEEQHDILVRDLSGGQRARVALARLLLQDPAVLLLDEPTNHLDIAGREWLENFLADEFTGAVVLISHDRYMLDRVVDRIIEIEDARLLDYPGNYHAFRDQRVQRRLTQLRAYEKQQTTFKREEAFIRKFKAGQRAKQARGRESRLERAKQGSIEKPLELDELRLSIPKARRSGDLAVVTRELSKGYTNDDGSRNQLFKDLTLRVERAQRWGIIGPNGSGKSTLVRCLLGEQDADSGDIKLGSNLDIGHFRQTHDDLDPTKTVYRHIQDTVRALTDEQVVLSELQARTIAGAFLFSGSDQEKEIAVLSGGERARAVLAALLASAKNLVVLDEPTNHLDISAAERLEAAFARATHDPKTGKTTQALYEGTLILISHDRALIDAVCDHLLILDGRGGAEIFAGTYREWKQTQDELASSPRREHTQSTASTEPSTPPPSSSKPTTKSRFSWMPVESIEERMRDLESTIRTLDAELGGTEIWTDIERVNDVTSKRDDAKAELDELEEEWLRKSS